MAQAFISYDTLKKYIYQFEKQQHEALVLSHDIEAATEQTALVGHGPLAPDVDALFRPLLDSELRKISSFYALQERGMQQELPELEELVKEQDELGMTVGRLYDGHWDDGDDDDDDDEDWQSTDRSADPQGRHGSRRRRCLSNTTDRMAHFSPGEHTIYIFCRR
jgi:phosphate transporter